MTAPNPRGVTPHGAVSELTSGLPGLPTSPAFTEYGPASVLSPIFFVVEVQIYKPGAAVLTVNEGHGTAPRGALATFPDALESYETLRASDVGYRTTSGTGAAVLGEFLLGVNVLGTGP